MAKQKTTLLSILTSVYFNFHERTYIESSLQGAQYGISWYAK